MGNGGDTSETSRGPFSLGKEYIKEFVALVNTVEVISTDKRTDR